MSGSLGEYTPWVRSFWCTQDIVGVYQNILKSLAIITFHLSLSAFYVKINYSMCEQGEIGFEWVLRTDGRTRYSIFKNRFF